MNISSAVALRVSNILSERNKSFYSLEKDTDIPHNTMKTLMRETNKSVNLRTVMQIAKGLNMTLSEFFNDPIFESEELEIY